MKIITINTDYKTPLSNSIDKTTLSRVDEISKPALSLPETRSLPSLSETTRVQLVSDDKKNGALWQCAGSTPAPIGTGKIECFQLKPAFNPYLNPDAKEAEEEKTREIFPAIEPVVQFSGSWKLDDLRCVGFGSSDSFIELLTQLGFKCELKNNEFYLYVPDLTALQAAWEKYRQIHSSEGLPPLNIILSKGIASDRAFINAFYTHDGLISTDAELLHDQIHLIDLLQLIWMTKGNYTATRKTLRNTIKLAADFPFQRAVACEKTLPFRRELEIMIGMVIDSITPIQIIELANQKQLSTPPVAVRLPTASHCAILTKQIRGLLYDNRWGAYLEKRGVSQNVSCLLEAWHNMQMNFFLEQAGVTISTDDLKPLLGLVEEFVKVLALLAEHNFLNQNSWNLLTKLYPHSINKQTSLLTDVAKYRFESLNTQERRDQALKILKEYEVVSEEALKIFEESRAPLHCAAVLIALAKNSAIPEVKPDLFFKLELERVLSTAPSEEILRKSGDPVSMRAHLSLLKEHNLHDCTFAVLEHSDAPLSLAQALVWIVEGLKMGGKSILPEGVKREFRKISTLPELGGYRKQINEIVEQINREHPHAFNSGSDSPIESFWKQLLNIGQ